MAETLQSLSLPEDLIIFEILGRLESVKSIGRCKCVSKAWRSRLSTPDFVKSHLKKSHSNGPQNFFYIKPNYSPYVATLTTKSCGNHKVTNRKVKFAEFDSKLHCFVHGSCNGLVLLGTDVCLQYKRQGANLVLLNPITEDFVKIPPMPACDFQYGYGLGYDSCRDDYKIVYIQKHVLNVYSVKTQKWRTLRNSSPDFFFYQYVYTYNSNQKICVNGRLYFLSPGNNKFLVIAAINLDTEEFESVPYPEGFDNYQKHKFFLFDLGGCLAIMDDTGPSYDVWLMKDYSVQNSWTKFTVNVSPCYYKPLFFIGEDEIVLFETRKSIVYTYNHKSGDSRDMVVDGIPICIGSAIVRSGSSIKFRESLVSPTFAIS